MTAPPCGLCGRPATGFATIDGRRYCHGDDDPDPTCYVRASTTRRRKRVTDLRPNLSKPVRRPTGPDDAKGAR